MRVSFVLCAAMAACDGRSEAIPPAPRPSVSAQLASSASAPIEPRPAPSASASTSTRPLSFVRGREVAGIVFGTTLADFRLACGGAGLKVDAFDAEDESEAVLDKRWMGRISKCSGLPRAAGFDLGKVLEVGVTFHDGRLGATYVFVDAAPDVVEARLAAAYPETITDLDRMVHVIGAAKEEDDLVSVAVGPTRVRGAASVVTFLSERGKKAPLPGAPWFKPRKP